MLGGDIYVPHAIDVDGQIIALFDPVTHQAREREEEGVLIERNLQMRACHPRDLIDQIVSLCRYHQRPAEITPHLLDTVCQSYLLDDAQSGATSAR